MGGGLESRCVGRVCGAEGAVHLVPCLMSCKSLTKEQDSCLL